MQLLRRGEEQSPVWLSRKCTISFVSCRCSEYRNCSECHPSLHPPLKRGEERSSMATIDCKNTQSAMPASCSEGAAASPHRRLRSCQFYLTSRQNILLKWSLRVWSYQWYDKEPPQLKFTMGKNWWEQSECNRKDKYIDLLAFIVIHCRHFRK